MDLMEKYGIEKVVVSMGSAGALYVTKEKALYAEGLKVPVGSTVGAGDSVVGALAVAEESGMTLEDTVSSICSNRSSQCNVQRNPGCRVFGDTGTDLQRLCIARYRKTFVSKVFFVAKI